MGTCICRGQRTTSRTWFLHPTMWVTGTEVRSSGSNGDLEGTPLSVSDWGRKVHLECGGTAPGAGEQITRREKARALAHSLLWSWPSASIMALPAQCEQKEPFIPEVVFVRGSVWAARKKLNTTGIKIKLHRYKKLSVFGRGRYLNVADEQVKSFFLLFWTKRGKTLSALRCV